MLGFPSGFRCVLAAPLSEPNVTFPFSYVNVDCGIVLCGSECEFVESLTFFSLSLQKARSVFLLKVKRI